MAMRRAAKTAPTTKRRRGGEGWRACPRTFRDELPDIGRSILREELAFLRRDVAERFEEYFSILDPGRPA